jgi:hypothetical protein
MIDCEYNVFLWNLLQTKKVCKIFQPCRRSWAIYFPIKYFKRVFFAANEFTAYVLCWNSD